MGKARVYLRVAKDPQGGYVSQASKAMTAEPLRRSQTKGAPFIPTVFMTLDLDIPDEAFQPPSVHVALQVPKEAVFPCVQVIDSLKILEEKSAAAANGKVSPQEGS
ncbi:MAG: hypothetical protein WC683_15745 [bacterium]